MILTADYSIPMNLLKTSLWVSKDVNSEVAQ